MGLASFAYVGGSYDNGLLDGLWSVNVNNAFSNANGNIGGSHSCVVCVYKFTHINLHIT